jgi:GNAT superfamily N-acetyltransferase
MPEIDVQPFEDEHLEPAAALLADRHARHRAAEPLLPAIEDFRSQIEASLARERAEGVVAIDGDDVVAYLIGAVEDDPLLGSPRAYVDFAGCAASNPEAVRDLYSALAARWFAAGCVRHAAAIPASDEALLDSWLRLAFGVQFVWAARETARMRPVEVDVQIRPGTSDDLEVAARLERDLWELQAQSPSFSGLSVPAQEHFWDDWAGTWDESETYTHFVAERDGAPVGHLLLYARPAGDLRVPERSVDLANAFTLPTVRRSGVGLALTGHALTWAKEHGRDAITADWRSVNLPASRFWPRRGFRPQYFRLYRRVP